MRASRKRTAIFEKLWEMENEQGKLKPPIGGFNFRNLVPAARMFGGFAPSCEAKAPLRQELHPLTF